MSCLPLHPELGSLTPLPVVLSDQEPGGQPVTSDTAWQLSHHLAEMWPRCGAEGLGHVSPLLAGPSQSRPQQPVQVADPRPLA